MTLKPIAFLATCILFTGCWLSNKTLPLPPDEPTYSKPVTKPYRFSEPKKVKWLSIQSDSIHRGRISGFDISKLPSRPFNPKGIYPLLKPVVKAPFNYNALPDTVLNLDVIPDEPFVYKTTLLGPVKKGVLGAPKIRTESYNTSFQYGEESGLPGANVQAMLHTRDGLFWIATNTGVCIVNGESMEILPGSFGTVYSMAEDKMGQVWIRSREGWVYIVDRKAGILKTVNFKTGIHVRIDKNGYVWITCFNRGVFRISSDQKTYKHITQANGLSTNNAVVTLEDKSGRIWISYGNFGADILDPGLHKIKRLGTNQGLSNQTVASMIETESGNIFLGNYHHGVDIVNIAGNTLTHIDSVQGIPPSFIFNMIEDDENRVWLCTDSSGVYILSKNADSLTHFGSAEGLGDDAVWSVCKDDQHQMYVGTLSGGVNVFPPSGEVAHHLSKREGLLDAEMWGMMVDSKKRLWMGSYSGVNIVTADQKILSFVPDPTIARNNRTQSFVQISPDQFIMASLGSGLYLIDETKHTIEHIDTKQGLPSASIFYVMQDSKKRLWIGTADAGVAIFDMEKRSFQQLNQANGLSNNRVGSVVEISPDHFLVATFAGVDLVNLSDSTVSNYSTKEGLSNDQIGGIFMDSKKRCWAYTERGINLLDFSHGTNTIFNMSSGLPSNGVYSFIEKEGDLYAGTGKGLTVFHQSDKITNGVKDSSWDIHSYGKAQGFAYLDFNGNTAAVTSDNNFWWGIISGVTVMNQSAIIPDTITTPPRVSGIDILGKSQYFIDPMLTHNVDTLYSESSDTFYLKNAFASLNSDKEKGILWDSLSSENMPVNLSLPHARNYLRFHYSNSLPQTQEFNQYRYILDGVDEKWSAVTDQTATENYNNISPGSYTFRAVARKGSGKWSEPSVYHFRIRPPWWFSWWAELAYALLFIGLLRLWVTYRSRRLLKENALLEQKVTDRTLELSNSLENLRQTQGQLIQAEKMASLGELTAGIAHEIQNPLNFVNNFSEVNTELLEDANKALEEGDIPEVKDLLKDVGMNMGKITFHGKRADAIVKGMLLHSRANSGQKIPTDVNALADEYLRLSYHGLRAKDKSFNAQFTMDFDENTGQVLLVQQDIGRVLLNLFNNAFYSVTEKKKSQPEGYSPTVSVKTTRKNDIIEIRIRDNGQGIPKKVIDKIYQPFFTTKPAGQGTGLGLSLSYDIITKEHNGKIDVVTKENEFTEFIIELPVLIAA